MTGYASGLATKRCCGLLELDASTRCHTTICFKRIKKVRPIKVLDKYNHFELSLSQIGSTLSQYLLISK